MEYRIQSETLTGLADEVRRLAKLERLLTPEEMKAELQKLTITKQEALWAYLDRTTLHLSRADSFVQNGTVLEVRYG